MVSPCHKVSTELLTLAGPSRARSDSRASGRYVSLNIPGRESDPISMGPRP